MGRTPVGTKGFEGQGLKVRRTKSGVPKMELVFITFSTHWLLQDMGVAIVVTLVAAGVAVAEDLVVVAHRGIGNDDSRR